MSQKLNVTEPHPTVAKSGYMYGGRGGAGNFKKYNAKELSQGPNATGPASRAPLPRPFSKRIMTAGRGGAGNMIAENEESIFKFDEELVSKRDDDSAPVFRIGRGGAGNHFQSGPKPSSSRKDSTDSSASESERPSSTTNPLGALRRNSALSIFTRRSS